MRSVMGIAVFSGMLGVTFFGLFFTPMFYVLLRKLEGNRKYHQGDAAEQPGVLEENKTGNHFSHAAGLEQHEVKV